MLPSDATLTVSMSASKTFPPRAAVSCNAARAAGRRSALRSRNARTAWTWSRFSSSVERISSAPRISAPPSSAPRNVLTPTIGSRPSCFIVS